MKRTHTTDEDDEKEEEQAAADRALYHNTVHLVQAHGLPWAVVEFIFLELPDEMLTKIALEVYEDAQALILTNKRLRLVVTKAIGTHFIRLVREGVERLEKWGGYTYADMQDFVGPLVTWIRRNKGNFPLTWYGKWFGELLYPAGPHGDRRIPKPRRANDTESPWLQYIRYEYASRNGMTLLSCWGDLGGTQRWNAVYWMLYTASESTGPTHFYAIQATVQVLHNLTAFYQDGLVLSNAFLDNLTQYWWMSRTGFHNVTDASYTQQHPNDPAPNAVAYRFPTVRLLAQYVLDNDTARVYVDATAHIQVLQGLAKLPQRSDDEPVAVRSMDDLYMPLTTYNAEGLVHFLIQMKDTLSQLYIPHIWGIISPTGYFNQPRVQLALQDAIGRRLLDTPPTGSILVAYYIRTFRRSVEDGVLSFFESIPSPRPPDLVLLALKGLEGDADYDQILTHLAADGDPILDPRVPLTFSDEAEGVIGLVDYLMLRALFYILRTTTGRLSDAEMQTRIMQSNTEYTLSAVFELLIALMEWQHPITGERLLPSSSSSSSSSSNNTASTSSFSWRHSLNATHTATVLHAFRQITQLGHDDSEQVRAVWDMVIRGSPDGVEAVEKGLKEFGL